MMPTVKTQKLVKFHSKNDEKTRTLYTTTFIFAMNKTRYESLPTNLKAMIDANGNADASTWIDKMCFS